MAHFLPGAFAKGDALLDRCRRGAGEFRFVVKQWIIPSGHRDIHSGFQVSQPTQLADNPPTDFLDHVCHVGIAGGTEKGGYVANCAEVAVDRTSGTVQLIRVVTAFECGAIVNPDGLKNQVEGAIMQGIGGALFEAIEFADGKILNPRFSQYRVPRYSDMPQLETILLNRPDLPSAGAGECPIVALAPAVGNAIFDATGVRLRSLPLNLHGLPT